jgi:hypothetical protein
MCACTETDMRESANDCTIASGEGHGSHGEMLHPICNARPMCSSAERTVPAIYPVFLHCMCPGVEMASSSVNRKCGTLIDQILANKMHLQYNTILLYNHNFF